MRRLYSIGTALKDFGEKIGSVRLVAIGHKIRRHYS